MKPVFGLFWKYGLALAVAAALTYFPVTGFFLPFFTGGLLPALICNLFLLHLVYLAYWRRIGLVWLLVPIVCYGAWLHWVIGKNAAADEEKARLENENHITEPIDKNMTLMFPENDSLAIRSRRHLLAPVRVFMGPIEFSADKGQSCTSYYCAKDLPPAPPTNPIVFHRLDKPDLASPIHIYRYELTSGDRVIGHFNFGTLATPSRWPFFVAACFLIDQPSSWQCVMRPQMQELSVGGDWIDHYDTGHLRSDPAIKILANMLGVQYADGDPNQRY